MSTQQRHFLIRSLESARLHAQLPRAFQGFHLDHRASLFPNIPYVGVDQF
jgi:hypothetical protein